MAKIKDEIIKEQEFKETEPIKEGFWFDEAKHIYYLNGKRLYGITTILGVINKPALIQWAANMACDYIDKAVLDSVRDVEKNTGEAMETVEIFVEDLKGYLTEARVAHRKNKEKAADSGTEIHAEVEKFIKNAIANHNGKPLGEYPERIKPFVDWAINNDLTFKESELKMYSEKLWVAGTTDFVIEKDGKTYIGDLKTYKKLWGREPMLQMAGYGIMYEEMFGKKVDGYVVFRLKDDWEEKWSYDVEGDKEGFLSALKLFLTLENWK